MIGRWLSGGSGRTGVWGEPPPFGGAGLFGVRGVAVPPAGGAGLGEAWAITWSRAAFAVAVVCAGGSVCAPATLIAPANSTTAAHSAVMVRISGREGCDASI